MVCFLYNKPSWQKNQKNFWQLLPLTQYPFIQSWSENPAKKNMNIMKHIFCSCFECFECCYPCFFWPWKHTYLIEVWFMEEVTKPVRLSKGAELCCHSIPQLLLIIKTSPLWRTLFVRSKLLPLPVFISTKRSERALRIDVENCQWLFNTGNSWMQVTIKQL